MNKLRLTVAWGSLKTITTLIVFTFVVGSHPSRGQTISRPVLIDEYSGSLSCHDLRGRIEMLMSEVVASPKTRGVVVIHGIKNEPLTAYRHKALLAGYIDIREFDKSRIVFTRGADENRLRVQMWKALAGSVLPVEAPRSWDYRLPIPKETLIFFQESWKNEECPKTFSFRTYARFLHANRSLSGQIVIKANSFDGFRKRRKLILREMAENKIGKARLLFHFSRSVDGDIEYGFVRKK